MPNLPFDRMVADCDEREARIVRAAQNKRSGGLRASKPFGRIDFDGDEDEAIFRASANYVWRMLCFDYCGFHPHNCMPVTADWDFSAVYYTREQRGEYSDHADRKADQKSAQDALDALIKRVESVLPVTAQKGVMQWGAGFGDATAWKGKSGCVTCTVYSVCSEREVCDEESVRSGNEGFAACGGHRGRSDRGMRAGCRGYRGRWRPGSLF